MSNAKFDIINETCPFCGQRKIVEFDEHYLFCPNCAAIYTFMIVQDAKCSHVNDNTPVLFNQPWTKRFKGFPFYIVDKDGKQTCGFCGKECIADGW